MSFDNESDGISPSGKPAYSSNNNNRLKLSNIDAEGQISINTVYIISSAQKDCNDTAIVTNKRKGKSKHIPLKINPMSHILAIHNEHNWDVVAKNYGASMMMLHYLH